jgi:large subunit ribosomal protein L28
MPPPLARLSLGPLTFLRGFTNTASRSSKSSAKRLAEEHSAVPPYPYGPSMFYKQSNFGLYGTAKIRYGNKVSEKNEIKTRRFWRPNVHQKRLWSKALGKYLRLRVTTRVLRTIDKCGGLDEYLLGEKPARIKELGMGGWKLRWRLMQTDTVKERFRLQREALGLPPKEDIHVSSDGEVVSGEQVAREVLCYDNALDMEDAEVEIGELQDDVPAEEGFMHEQPPPSPSQKPERATL